MVTGVPRSGFSVIVKVEVEVLDVVVWDEEDAEVRARLVYGLGMRGRMYWGRN